MEIIVEIILWAVIVLGAVLGAKRGFIGMAAKPVKFVASLIIAFSFCAAFAETAVAPMVEEPITGYLTEFLYENCAEITPENVNEELPTLLKFSASLIGIDIAELAAENSTAILDAIVDTLTAPVVEVISVIIAFVVLYFAARIACWLVVLLIEAIVNMGFVGVLNKILGFVFGTAFAFIVAWGLAVIAEMVFHLPVFDANELISSFEGGMLYTFFNTYNPIELLLSF